jgi:hypothetical protein
LGSGLVFKYYSEKRYCKWNAEMQDLTLHIPLFRRYAIQDFGVNLTLWE